MFDLFGIKTLQALKKFENERRIRKLQATHDKNASKRKKLEFDIEFQKYKNRCETMASKEDLIRSGAWDNLRDNPMEMEKKTLGKKKYGKCIKWREMQDRILSSHGYDSKCVDKFNVEHELAHYKYNWKTGKAERVI